MSRTELKQRLDGVLGIYDLKQEVVSAIRLIADGRDELRLADIDERVSVQRRDNHAETLSVDAVRIDTSYRDNVELKVSDNDGTDLGWLPLYHFNVGDTLISLALALRSHL